MKKLLSFSLLFLWTLPLRADFNWTGNASGRGAGISNIILASTSGTLPDAKLSTNALIFANVKLFGATTGDFTDDTAAFNWAIRYCSTNGTYSTVFVPEGDYYFGPTEGGIVMRHNVRLVGEGKASRLMYFHNGAWTNAVIRIAEGDDGNTATHASIHLSDLAIMSQAPPTNMTVIDLTGSRGSVIENLYLLGYQYSGQTAIRFSNTNIAGSSETCFFNVVRDSVITASTSFEFSSSGVSTVDNGLHRIENISGSSTNVLKFIGESQVALGLQILNSYFASTEGLPPVLPAGTLPEGVFSHNTGLEGYAADTVWDTLGLLVGNVSYSYSKLQGLVSPEHYAASLQGYSPLYPNSLSSDQYVITGLSVISNAASSVTIQGGSAVNRHYISGAGYGLFVTNTGSSHTCYVGITTNVYGKMDHRAVVLQEAQTNISHMILADVYVNPAGVITNIVDRRVFLPAPKFRSVTLTEGAFGNGFGLSNIVAEAILSSTPSTVSSIGLPGMIRYDSAYVYICIATNTWRRSALCPW